MLKLITPFLIIIFTLFSTNAVAAIDADLNEVIELVTKLGVEDDIDYGSKGAEVGEDICKAAKGSSCYNVTNIGEGICKAFKGSSCYNVTNIGEGICKAGKGSTCYNVTSIGEGICKAGKGSSCYNVTNIGEGICKARKGSSCTYMSISKALSLPVPDTEWKWDQFNSPNAYGNVWACRGLASGQFAEDDKCAGEAKNDNTLPNN